MKSVKNLKVNKNALVALSLCSVLTLTGCGKTLIGCGNKQNIDFNKFFNAA